MGELVALPLWLVVLVGLLAALSLFAHFLMPGTRWVLRRRVYRVIEDVNSRLNIELPPFLLTKRDRLIDRLIYDDKVLQAAADTAAERDVPQQTVVEEVRGYAEEIVPGFNAYFYFRLGYRIARRFIRFFYRVRLGYADLRTLDMVDRNACLVLVMNHRSNFDYLLVTYLASRRAALSYAAGEGTLFWPVANLLRAMGAYFVRRNSRNPLYRRVVERYVQLAVDGRVPQAIFPEGGLSQDGGLRPPRAGLIDYMMRGFDPETSTDIVFIPIGLNYERIAEDRTLLLHGDEALISQRGTTFIPEIDRRVFRSHLDRAAVRAAPEVRPRLRQFRGAALAQGLARGERGRARRSRPRDPLRRFHETGDPVDGRGRRADPRPAGVADRHRGRGKPGRGAERGST